METRKTHFEQILVATVKKMAYEFPVSEIGDRMPDVNVSTSGDWHEVAQRVRGETDSEKVLELVQELIEKYDEEKTRKCRSGRNAGLSPTTSTVSDGPLQT
jgi:hypothetical protein